MALEKELETYHQKLPELIAEEGKFVVIHAEEVAGTFTSAEDAIKAGYEKYKLEPFLVKQIRAVELVQFISRFVDPHIQGLIGRDILEECVLHYNGTMGLFTLAF